MKKILIALVLSVSCSSFTHAQATWLGEDALWYFDLSPQIGEIVFLEMFSTGDTLINETSCTKINSQFYGTFIPGGPLYPALQEEFYLYFNGDTVFWYFDQAFHPLVCFNLDVGESWYPIPPDYDGIFETCEVNPVTIESKTTVEYNGELYRSITIEDNYGPEMNYIFWGGTFDERILWNNTHVPRIHGCYEVIYEYPYELDLRCYQDSELSIFNYESCVLSNENHMEIPNNPVYPNPIDSGERLYINEFDFVKIYSLSGQLHYTRDGKVNPGYIKIQLRPGIYSLVVHQGQKTGYQKLIVK